jgi:hypothetical protein
LTFDQLRERIGTSIRETGSGDRDTATHPSDVAVQVLAAHGNLPDAPRRIDADLLKKDTYYAIPDENLDLLPTLAKAALSVASDGGIGAIGELIGVLYRYRTLNVQIDGDQAAVLRAPKSADGALSAADVRQRVEAAGVRLRRPVSQVLAELESRRRGVTVLVHNVNGRWAIGNV